ncbi:unnamed protein product [Phytophthora fragariaefolia]|uniref:Unnamed protein product n=1 Tax=Phytophthora fragariaefolia TaxID=1490495 RepID=A0A9W6XN27_9STRA|nr:unnamed protein product [Phytophthora fragariaefolia]
MELSFCRCHPKPSALSTKLDQSTGLWAFHMLDIKRVGTYGRHMVIFTCCLYHALVTGGGGLNNAEVAEVGTADVDNTGTCTQHAHVDATEREGPPSDIEGPEVGPAETSDTNIVEIAGCGDTIQPNPCSGGHTGQMGSETRGGRDAPDRHAARGGHESSRYHDGRGICSGRSSHEGDDDTGGRGSRGGRGDRRIPSYHLEAEEQCNRNSVDDTQSGIALISKPVSSVAVVDLVTPPTL